MSKQNLLEKLKDLTGGKLDLMNSWILAPLTTGLSVDTPSDVIGVCLKNLLTPGCLMITLENRDWTISAQYTGLTEELYRSAIDTDRGMESILRTKENIICFASSLAASAFSVTGIKAPPIITLPKLLRMYEAFPVELEKKLEAIQQGEEPMSSATLRSVINGVSVPRMLSRVDWLHRMEASFDDRQELPVIEFNLGIDAACVNKALLG